MPLLDVVQDVAMLVGVPKPASVASSTDTNVAQLMALANEEVKELAKRVRWENITIEYSFVTQAQEIQLYVGPIIGSTGGVPQITDLDFIVNDTLWNRSLRRPVFGPLAPRTWQQLRAQNMQGPWNQYRIRQNAMRFIPNPAAGQTIAFEYVSTQRVLAVDGVTTRTAYTQDTDTALVDEEIVRLGLRWRYLKAKGLNYAEDFATYERQINDRIARDGVAPNLDAAGTPDTLYPGILVPAGNWFHN